MSLLAGTPLVCYTLQHICTYSVYLSKYVKSDEFLYI